MNKLFAGFALLFAVGQMLSGPLEGVSGIVSTRLTSSLSSTQSSTITVDSTTGFPSTGILFVEAEIIRYTGKTALTFTGISRGAFNTDPVAHSGNTRVYNDTTGVLNQGAGFQIAEAVTNSGPYKALTSMPGFLGSTVGRFILWDMSFFSGDLWGFPLVYFQMFMVAISLGLVAMVATIFIGVAQSILQRIP